MVNSRVSRLGAGKPTRGVCGGGGGGGAYTRPRRNGRPAIEFLLSSARASATAVQSSNRHVVCRSCPAHSPRVLSVVVLLVVVAACTPLQPHIPAPPTSNRRLLAPLRGISRENVPVLPACTTPADQARYSPVRICLPPLEARYSRSSSPRTGPTMVRLTFVVLALTFWLNARPGGVSGQGKLYPYTVFFFFFTVYTCVYM